MSCENVPRLRKGTLEVREYTANFYKYTEIQKFRQSLASASVVSITGPDSSLTNQGVRVIDVDLDGLNERVGVMLAGGTVGEIYTVTITALTNAAPARTLEFIGEIEITD